MLRLVHFVVVAASLVDARLINYLAMQLVLILEASLSSITRWQAFGSAGATAYYTLLILRLTTHLEVRIVAFPTVLLAQLILVNDSVDTPLSMLTHRDELLVGVLIAVARLRAVVVRQVQFLLVAASLSEAQHLGRTLLFNARLAPRLQLPRVLLAFTRVMVPLLVAHVALLDCARELVLRLLAASISVHQEAVLVLTAALQHSLRAGYEQVLLTDVIALSLRGTQKMVLRLGPNQRLLTVVIAESAGLLVREYFCIARRVVQRASGLLSNHRFVAAAVSHRLLVDSRQTIERMLLMIVSVKLRSRYIGQSRVA